jgi:hypothetical protein
MLDLSAFDQEMLLQRWFCEDNVSVKVCVLGQLLLFLAAMNSI